MMYLEFALLALSLALLVAGLVAADGENKAAGSAFSSPLEDRVPTFSTPVPVPPLSTPPPPATPPVIRTERVEVPVVPTNPLDNTPLLSLLEDLSRFSSDLAADAEHFSQTDRELSDFVMERIMEMIERVPGVTGIVPAPGTIAVRGEHKGVDGAFRAGTIRRLLLPGVRVAERIIRPALVEFD